MTALSGSLGFLLALWLGASACASRASFGDIEEYSGIYASPDGGIIELHRANEAAGHEAALRGYLRTKERIAALAAVEMHDGALTARATHDDGITAELRAALMSGPVLVLDGEEYRRSDVERPADATVRREIDEAYARLAAAVETKDYAAFQALRVAEFATIPPDGIPSPGSRMAERARGLLERIQPPITTKNEVLELTVRGKDAIATVRQKFTRMQLIEGTPHTIHTEVTQRETWTRTPEGWKLLFVDEVRDHLTLDDGRRVK